jgi:hypothetical protein
MSIGVSEAHNDDVHVDYDKIEDDNSSFLMFLGYYLFDIETKGWIFKNQYFKEKGRCQVDAVHIESKDQVREINIGEYQTVLTETEDGKLVYCVPSKTYSMCRDHMTNFMGDLEIEGWDVDDPVKDVAKKPDNSNIFCYPNLILEYMNSGNEEGVPPVPLESWYLEKS